MSVFRLEPTSRKGHFCVCHDDALFALKGAELRVYLLIMKKGLIPSAREISRLLGMGPGTVYKAFRALKEQGFMWFETEEDGSLSPMVEHGKLKPATEYEFYETPTINPHAAQPEKQQETFLKQKRSRNRNVSIPEQGNVSEIETLCSEIETVPVSEIETVSYIDTRDKSKAYKSNHKSSSKKALPRSDDDFGGNSRKTEIRRATEKFSDDVLLDLAAGLDEHTSIDDLRFVLFEYKPSILELSRAITAIHNNPDLRTKVGFLKSERAWIVTKTQTTFNESTCPPRASPKSRGQREFESEVALLQTYCQQEG